MGRLILITLILSGTFEPASVQLIFAQGSPGGRVNLNTVSKVANFPPGTITTPVGNIIRQIDDDEYVPR